MFYLELPEALQNHEDTVVSLMCPCSSPILSLNPSGCLSPPFSTVTESLTLNLHIPSSIFQFITDSSLCSLLLISFLVCVLYGEDHKKLKGR